MSEKKAKMQFGIVATIMALFKLGDEGKLSSYFARLEKDFNREISKLRNNLNATTLVFEEQQALLTEKLEDASQEIDDAWANVKPENITTNADQDAYKEEYLSRIERAEAKVEEITEQLADLEKSYKEKVDSIQKTIEYYEARIERINS